MSSITFSHSQTSASTYIEHSASSDSSQELSVASLKNVFDSTSHKKLLAAAEKAKTKFEALPKSEERPAIVTQNIIERERATASGAATHAREATTQAPLIINRLRNKSTAQTTWPKISALESRLQEAFEKTTAAATIASKSPQKEAVQLAAKTATFHAATAELALIELKDLESEKNFQKSDLSKATEKYKKAFQELESHIKASAPSPTSSISDEEAADDMDDGAQHFREVSDEEAMRRYGPQKLIE